MLSDFRVLMAWTARRKQPLAKAWSVFISNTHTHTKTTQEPSATTLYFPSGDPIVPAPGQGSSLLHWVGPAWIRAPKHGGDNGMWVLLKRTRRVHRGKTGVDWMKRMKGHLQFCLDADGKREIKQTHRWSRLCVKLLVVIRLEADFSSRLKRKRSGANAPTCALLRSPAPPWVLIMNERFNVLFLHHSFLSSTLTSSRSRCCAAVR